MMVCPLCRVELVKRYRVIDRMGGWDGPTTRRRQKVYIPLWVCLSHKFSVEINRLSKHIVTSKPKSKRARRAIGSASES